MKSISHKPIFRRYHGQWVVLDASRERVIASGKTLKEALSKFHADRHKEAFSVLKVPTKLAPYVGSAI